MNTKQLILKSTTTLAMCAAVLMFSPNASASEKDTLNAADVKFVKTQAAAGKAEVKISELAVKKADRADVKALAAMLVTDHTAVNAELKALASKKGVELSAVISPAHAATFQKLEKLEGANFDKEFLSVIISDHKKCISNFKVASTDSKDTDLRVWVDKTIPALKSHLEKAEALNVKALSAR
jgi:putative membrane protein